MSCVVCMLTKAHWTEVGNSMLHSLMVCKLICNSSTERPVMLSTAKCFADSAWVWQRWGGGGGAPKGEKET